jgi:hypothetical protein
MSSPQSIIAQELLEMGLSVDQSEDWAFSIAIALADAIADEGCIDENNGKLYFTNIHPDMTGDGDDDHG